MLTKLDRSRFNYVIKTGRRFYVASELIRKYCNALCAPRFVNLHMNSVSFSRSYCNNSLYISNDDDFFNSMHIYYDDEEEENYDSDEEENEDSENQEDDLSYFRMFEYDGRMFTRTHEIFRCLGETLFINRYSNLNYSEFRNKYYETYSVEIADMMYAATVSIVPIEINNDCLNIVCTYGDLTFLPHDRFPLIDVLYRSDEAVNFINGFISLIMTSSIMFMNVISRTVSSLHNSTSINNLYKHCNRSWNPDIYDLSRCFSQFQR